MPGILWAVLDAESEARLLAEPRRFANGRPHHCTLQFKVESADFQNWIGLTFDATVTGIYRNDSIEAYTISLPTSIPCSRPHPHISASWDEGTVPAAANEMLAGEHQGIELSIPVTLRVEFLEFD